MQWKGQKDWFLAYDTKNDPQPEHDLTVEGDSNAEGQIKGSLSKDAEEADRNQLVEGQLDEELDDEEMADAEQVDDEDDNLSSEEEEPPTKHRRTKNGSAREEVLGPRGLEKRAAKRQKDTENMRKWRAANPGSHKAKIATMAPDEKAVHKARRAENMRRLRAKWRNENPKSKHVPPDKNRLRNAVRQAQRKRASGPESRRTAMLRQRVQRAGYKVKKLIEANNLRVRYTTL
jgi:hypothetical protein